MATSSEPLPGLTSGRASEELVQGWRRLTRAATFVAVLMSPVAFVWFYDWLGIALGWSLLWTFLSVIAFRHRLVVPRLFSFAFQQLQDGRPILVLQPLASEG